MKKSNGSIVWSTEVATGVPVLLTGSLVVASDTDGNLVGVDKSSGQQLWSHEFDGDVLSAPALVDGKVFVSTFKSSAYLLDKNTGQQIQKISLGDGAITQPVVSGNQIYMLTNSANLVALSKI